MENLIYWNNTPVGIENFPGNIAWFSNATKEIIEKLSLK